MAQMAVQPQTDVPAANNKVNGFESPNKRPASTLTPMGTATRTIIASGAGPVSVQLDSLGGASGPVDFALGMPANDGRGCYLTRSVRTVPGSASALSLQVDPGRYCVRLADTGQLTSNTTFSVTITHP